MLPARQVNPAGAVCTESPWLIQTENSSDVSVNNNPRSVTVTGVRPNSLNPVWATSPPKAADIAWNP